MSEGFEVFPSTDGFYWQQAGRTHGPFDTRAEAQDDALEHVLARIRAEHGKRLAALYVALTTAP